MARRRTAPFVPLLYRRTICVANRKRKEKTKKTSIYYYRWWDDEGKEHRASTGCNLKSDTERRRNVRTPESTDTGIRAYLV